MEWERFETLVIGVIEDLPHEFRSKLENVDIIVQDWPTPGQLKKARLNHPSQLLGLYEGVPQIKRGRHYGLVLPDKISIFKNPVEAQCRSDAEIEARIAAVVRHEIAHHFGTGEATLQKIENERRKQSKQQ